MTDRTPRRLADITPRVRSNAVLFFLAALCTLLYVNWIFAIARFQPNVLFMDQWDFLYTLFYGGGWWDRFIHQHGPHRQGLGMVISAWILQATDLDVRYESVWIAHRSVSDVWISRIRMLRPVDSMAW